MKVRFTLNIKSAGIRLDQALLEEIRSKLPSLSRQTLKRCFKDKTIFLNHRPSQACEASHILPIGNHEIEIRGISEIAFADPKAMPSPRGCFLPIMYEDRDLLILHKKSGTPSLPLSPHETETAVNAALAHAPEIAGVGRGGLEPGLLHRLDTGTSGLLVFAKTMAEYKRLRTLWKNGKVEKRYRAIVTVQEGAQTLDDLPMTLTFPLAHDRKSSKKMVAYLASSKIRGKPLPAETIILKAKELSPPRRGHLDLEIQIHTGVMHQIRCHLSTIGWPIVGDPIYGGSPADRLWLHAWKLKIPLRSGTVLSLEAQLPQLF